MRFLRILTLLVPVSLGCLGCAEPLGAPALSEPKTEDGSLHAVSLDVFPPGIYAQEFHRKDGTILRYTLSVPQGYSKTAGAPLILALHFGGPGRGRPVPPFYGRSMLEILVQPALKDLNAVIVAPDSIAGRWSSEENEAAVLQIMDHVMAKYNVDQRKVLVTGFSMGGGGTWHMAGRHPERFSAAIPIAARVPAETVDWKVPLYVIHSRDDGLIPETPEARVAELQAQGADAQLVLIDGVTHHQTELYAKPLREAIPWIRQVWSDKPAAE